MKAEPENEVGNGDVVPLTGDVIGDTAYSERFVLKILLKLANRDTLKEEINETSFEEELCTLWDMTAERDVVMYLHNHDALNLFYFALPVIESSRIIEVIIGTVANMCCHKETVHSLTANKDLLVLLLDFLKSDDSQILNQLLRLISSCLYIVEKHDINMWMDLFESSELSPSIYFILMNSSNKELLMTALETLNTICMNCKVDGSQKFSTLFITQDSLKAVYTAHQEYCTQACPEEKLERLHLITIQMMLHLDNPGTSEADADQVTSQENSMSAIDLLRDILVSYESKIKEFYKINEDFVDVLEAAVIYVLDMGLPCSPDKYFIPSYNMWKVLRPNGRQKKYDNIQFMDDIKNGLGLIMCVYLSKCADDHLLQVLDHIGDDYGCIVSQISDAELQAKIANRALNYRIRMNENIDS